MTAEGNQKIDENANEQNRSNSCCESEAVVVELATSEDDLEVVAQDNHAAESIEENQVQESATTTDESKPVKLYKSTRLKGYITLSLASFINYTSAQNSADVSATGVASTLDQRRYAISVAVVSLLISVACLIVHLDRITRLEKVWVAAFRPKSKIEGLIIGFLTLWWSIGTGFTTSVAGIAGDGKGQYSLYYSSWLCTITSYWMLERWFVAADWPSLKSFISSWPNRAPAWICIMVLSIFTLIWYLDLWQDHDKLERANEAAVKTHFVDVGDGQWQWLMIVTVFTIVPSIAFVLAELFRETKADGSSTAKSWTETTLEGCCFLILVLAWIPTVLVATTPGGAASLVGNAYFFTWLLAIFVFEGLIWFIHDKRRETHHALKEKEKEYHRRQRKVLEQAQKIQDQHDALRRLSIKDTRNEQHTTTLPDGELWINRSRSSFWTESRDRINTY